jgi:DNA repair protein RadD
MLRDYQKKAVDRMLWAMTLDGNSVVVASTGSGKTHIIAEFAKKINQPILILAPSKELIEQNYTKLANVVDKAEIGLFSASVGSKEVNTYTLATIQSAYKHPDRFSHFEVVLIDECHGVNVKQLTTMYQKFFKAIGSPKIIGLTATPYRLDTFYKPTGKAWMPWETVTTTKMINRYQGFFWNRFVSVINTHELIEQGYLCPIRYELLNQYEHEDIPTNKSQSDFDLKVFEEMLMKKEQNIVAKLLELQDKHKTTLVFCSSVTQAERLQKAVLGSVVVSGTTPKKKRELIISQLKSGLLKTVFNYGVLTTGFDYPELDSMVVLRPTRSLNLHNQMIGRLTRLSEGKEFATVYDYSGNVSALGKLESIKIEKVDGKWNVTSETRPKGFHLVELYKFTPRRLDAWKEELQERRFGNLPK